MKLNIKNAVASIELAAQKLGKDPYELGCKFIFDQLELVDSLIAATKNKADDLYFDYTRVYNIADSDLYAETLADYRKAYEETREAEYKAKEYRQALTLTMKQYVKSCSPAEASLITVRGRVRAKKIRDAKPLPEGARSFKVIDKPIMKSFKIMKFMPKDLFGKTIRDLANKINLLLVKPQKETQDEFHARCKKIRDTFFELKKVSEDMLHSGKPYTVGAEAAKINNARQSMLTDSIGMIYGKTTEMMISVRHCIHDLFDDDVHKFLCYGDREKGMKLVNEVQVNLVQIAKTNGLDLKLLGKNARTLHFEFWDANNSQLKVGEFYMLSSPAAARAKVVGRCGMTEEEFNKIPANGSDLLKWLSYATTPGCPMKDDNGNFVTVDDVLVLDDIEITRLFKNVLVIDNAGNYKKFDEYNVSRTLADGMALLINIPSQQGRGAFAFKYFGLRIAGNGFNMIEEIAKREGLTLPDRIKNIDGDLVDWRKYKVITSKSTWKWAKYGLTYKEYARRMNKLAETYPNVNLLYTARLADAIEEDSKRKLARQTTQQFFDATSDQLKRLVSSDANRLKKLTTMPGIIRKFAGLDKEEKDRTAYEHFIEACPEFLAHPLMREKIMQMFDSQFAEAAMRPSVSGKYPYIADDPVALIKIWIFGMDPNKLGLGYLKEDEINIVSCEEHKKLFFVRYPANHLVGVIRYNHNDPIYAVCGNVCILSIDGDTIIRVDGDFDGDEGSACDDELVVELCEQVDVKKPLIVFPHEKMASKVITDKFARDRMISESIVVANRFGGAVGQYSNLATKCLQKAATSTDKQRKVHLMNAVWAHVATILAIDLAKTGEMVSWLVAILAGLEKTYGKMPWNQRFAKHTSEDPWYGSSWNFKTESESSSTPDRIARTLMDMFNVECALSKDAEGSTVTEDVPAKRVNIDLSNVTFDDPGIVLANVKNHSTAAVVTPSMFSSIEARNYRDKSEYESDGDNEFKLITDIKNGKEIGGLELFRFIWRNRASLVYKTSKAKISNDKIGNAEMVDGYYEWCHDLMLEFGKHGTNKLFTAMSEEDQKFATMNKFMKLAMASNSGVGKKVSSEEERIRRHSSFLDFTAKVFGYELYQTVAKKKGIKDVWVKTSSTPTEDSDKYQELDNTF